MSEHNHRKHPWSKGWACWSSQSGEFYRLNTDPTCEHPFDKWMDYSKIWLGTSDCGLGPWSEASEPKQTPRPEWRSAREAHHWGIDHPSRVIENEHDAPQRYYHEQLSAWMLQEKYGPVMPPIHDRWRPVKGDWDDE